MKKYILPFLLMVAAIAGVMAAFGTDAEDSSQADDTTDIVFLGELDLAERAEILRNQYRRMTPGDEPLVQDVGAWPAAWEEFSSRWASAPAERNLATWLVPVMAERSGTLTVLRDAAGNALWRGVTDFSKEESANVTLTGALVSEEDWVLWKAAREEIDRRLDAMRETETGLPSRLRDGEGGRGNGANDGPKMFMSASADFTVTPPEFRVGLQWTNDIVLDVFAYGPLHTASTQIVTFTNDENAVETQTNTLWHAVEPPLTGFDNHWEYVGAVALTNDEESVFVDTDFPPGRGIVRFYAAFEAGDADGDGLNDGYETFVTHTSLATPDTDGDGMDDGVEWKLGFNPLSAQDVPKILLNAVLYKPSGSIVSKEWVELYSSSVRDIDLGGFLLEIGNNGSWVCALEFPSNTIVAPGQCILVGESAVSNADITASLSIPNAWTNESTTGVRLRWNDSDDAVADVVFIGGGMEFNDAGLDTTGWEDTNSVWTHAGHVLERRFPGVDNDMPYDWHEVAGRDGRPSSVVLDFDGDGLGDGDEWTGRLNPRGKPTNPWNTDSDGDGLDDYTECVTYGTDPNTWATDGDIYPWPPASGAVADWWGSDPYEIAHGWNPLVADENANDIPDSWEMAFPGTNLTADADGDGTSNLVELENNSNPCDANSTDYAPYVLRFESSVPNWQNNGMIDVGLGGWVKMHFCNLQSDQNLCIWVQEGQESEVFSATWSGIDDFAQGQLDMGQNIIAYAHAKPNSSPFLKIQDGQRKPWFTNTLGGEYKFEMLSADITGYEAWRGSDGNQVPDDEEEYPGFLVTAKHDYVGGGAPLDAKIVIHGISAPNGTTRWLRFSDCTKIRLYSEGLPSIGIIPAQEMQISNSLEESVSFQIWMEGSWWPETTATIELVLKDATGKQIPYCSDTVSLLAPVILAIGDSMTFGYRRTKTGIPETPNWGDPWLNYPTDTDWDGVVGEKTSPDYQG